MGAGYDFAVFDWKASYLSEDTRGYHRPGSTIDLRVVPGGGGGGALTLVLGTHCKTDSRSCGCKLEKGGLSQTQELSGGGLSEGHFLLGL